MSGWKKLAQAAAASSASLNIEDVFSTYLYTGDSTNSRQITNGIDLSGEGGMVITAPRSNGNVWSVADSERGATSWLYTNGTHAEQTGQDRYGTFNSDGYTMGSGSANSYMNYTGYTYCSWTFRKTPKFFDVVTWTGDGTNRSISHNLGSVPGMIVVKRLDSTSSWRTYHRGLNGGTNPEQYSVYLNETTAEFTGTVWQNTAPTSTEFYINNSSGVNASGGTYVAYLFAHNNSDGDFGPTADQDIIKCGSYTGNGSSQDIDLGFEPQWVLFKNSSYNDIYNISHWSIYDNMRGVIVGGDDSHLRPNTDDAEQTQNDELKFTATGFSPQLGIRTLNASGDNYIYIAIRRGPMAVPTDATDVFGMDTYDTTTGDPTAYDTTFTVDMVIQALNKHTTHNKLVNSRLTGTYYLKTNATDAQATASSYTFDTQTGFRLDPGTDANDFAWMWKRAPNFFDVVAYTGSGLSNVNTISHNLGVAPDMIWVKRRDSTNDWQVYHSDLNGGTTPEQYSISLNTTGTEQNRTYWNDTAPTSTTFQITDAINGNGDPYIAYLFASLDGVSKLGSYTGNGSSTARTIDCGFSSGARFVLIKRTDSTGNWFVFDTERGITSGDDKLLQLNKTNLEGTGQYIDPVSSGFATRTTDGDVNASGGTYIFYAIA